MADRRIGLAAGDAGFQRPHGDRQTGHQPGCGIGGAHLQGSQANAECSALASSWHGIRGTQLDEDAHRYRGDVAGALATLRTAALNLLRLARFRSI